jgi:hypothetical protein
MPSLKIPEDEFHRLLTTGQIQLDPPLSDDAIEKMRYNRNRDFHYPDMEFLDNEEAVQKYSTYADAALSAQSRLRKLSFSTQSTDDEIEIADKQKEVIRTSAIRMFSLLKPMLRYHEFWDEMEYDHLSGEGLKRLEEFEDRRSELSVDDAFMSVQKMRTATHTFGLLYDNQEQVIGAMEEVDYWRNELEQASEVDSEDKV